MMTNQTYMLCSPAKCFVAPYKTTSAEGYYILVDFFKSEIGLQLERESDPGLPENSYKGLVDIRMKTSNPYDRGFSIGSCNGIPCAGMGDKEEGIEFWQIKAFKQKKTDLGISGYVATQEKPKSSTALKK